MEGRKPLSAKEKKVASLFLNGFSNVEISEELRITRRTVVGHFQHMFSKYNITSGVKRVKLAVLLFREQLGKDTLFRVMKNNPGILPKGWVEWVEPFGPENEPVYMRATEATVIAVTKKIHPELTDEQALDEFLVVHWAEKGK